MGRGLRSLAAAVVVTSAMAAARMALADEAAEPVRVPMIGSAPTVDEVPADVVVEPGDHLWKISARHLDERLGRDASDAEISPYWRKVIDGNRARLRSGDPDLIYPGETISLPVVSGSP